MICVPISCVPMICVPIICVHRIGVPMICVPMICISCACDLFASPGPPSYLSLPLPLHCSNSLLSSSSCVALYSTEFTESTDKAISRNLWGPFLTDLKQLCGSNYTELTESTDKAISQNLWRPIPYWPQVAVWLRTLQRLQSLPIKPSVKNSEVHSLLTSSSFVAPYYTECTEFADKAISQNLWGPIPYWPRVAAWLRTIQSVQSLQIKPSVKTSSSFVAPY